MGRAERIESLRIVAEIPADMIRGAVHKIFPSADLQERRHQLQTMLLNRQQLLRDILIEERKTATDLGLFCSIAAIYLEDFEKHGKTGHTGQAQKWDEVKVHGFFSAKLAKRLRPEALKDTLERHGIDMHSAVSTRVQQDIAGANHDKISIDKLQKM